MPFYRLSYHILSVNLTAISSDIITIEFDMTLMLSRAKNIAFLNGESREKKEI